MRPHAIKFNRDVNYNLKNKLVCFYKTNYSINEDKNWAHSIPIPIAYESQTL